MNIELTPKQQNELHMAVLTRIRRVEDLISGWEGEKDPDSISLLERYNSDLEVLKELEIQLR